MTANLAGRDRAARAQQQLAADHSGATLLVNAAGFFIPRAFLEYDGVLRLLPRTGPGHLPHPDRRARHSDRWPRDAIVSMNLR